MTNQTTKPKGTAPTKTKLVAQNKEENTELKAQMVEMQKKMDSMTSVFNAFSNMTIQQPQDIKEKEVTFISLFYGALNLYTESNQRGVHYRFQKYGEEKRIPWTQAKNIVSVQEDFAKRGFFYIKDENFVKEFPILKDVYEKIVDKDSLENLFSLKKNTFKDAFEQLPQGQKELFADLIIKRSQEDGDVDLNIVKLAGDILQRDLLQEITQAEVAFSNKE